MNCKYMRTKYNYTPNDYDLTFSFEDIPSNIKLDDIISLNHIIGEVTPLGKKIHIQMNTTTNDYKAEIMLHSNLKMNGRRII